MPTLLSNAPINVMPHLPQIGPGRGYTRVLHQLISKVLTLGATLVFKIPTFPWSRVGDQSGALYQSMLMCMKDYKQNSGTHKVANS